MNMPSIPTRGVFRLFHFVRPAGGRRGFTPGLALGILLGLAGWAFASTPIPPVKVTLEPGKEGVVAVLNASASANDVVLQLQMESDDALLAAAKEGRIPEKAKPFSEKKITVSPKEKPLRLDVKWPSLKTGNYRLVARVMGREGEGGFSSVDVLAVVVDANGKIRALPPGDFVREKSQARQRDFEKLMKSSGDQDIRLLTEATQPLPEKIQVQEFKVESGRQMGSRPTGPSQIFKGYYREPEAGTWGKRDPITVRGRLTYVDFDGTVKPLVNVTVNLWDDDVFGDENLGNVATGWDGRWSFTVNNDDGWLQDGRDIYYTFKLENTRLGLRSTSLFHPIYEWHSATFDDRNDGSVVDFGTETGSTDLGSMQIWGHLNLAWNDINNLSGQDPGAIYGIWPMGGTFWTSFWQEINLMAADVDAPDVIYHEYGHALMYYAYSHYDASPGGSHGFDDASQNRSLSWSEGWATAWMLMARPDGRFNWHEGDGGRGIENFSSANRTGEAQEGRVAAALLDFFDAANDNNGATEDRGRNGAADTNSARRFGLDIMFRQAMWGSRHDDITEYWNQLSGELTAEQRAPARAIMNYNWMSGFGTSSCVATKVASIDSKDREALLGGLRRFRDLALAKTEGGNWLSRVYYANSPEMAMVLMGDAATRKYALQVMTHFSGIGAALGKESEGRRILESGQAVLPPKIEAAAQQLIARLKEKASPELLADLGLVEQVMASLKGMSLAELQGILRGGAGSGESKEPIRLQKMNPASRKAAETGKLPQD